MTRKNRNELVTGMNLVFKKKKVSARRQQVRNNISAERFSRLGRFLTGNTLLPSLTLVLFILAVLFLLSLDTTHPNFLASNMRLFKSLPEILALAVVVTFISLGAVLYIYHYQPRILSRPNRAFTMAALFFLLLAVNRIFSIWKGGVIYLATGTAVTSAIILTMVFDQRFALGITLFYSLLACFAVARMATVELFLTMMAGVVMCCFCLREIRTRMKLIEVSMFASIVVFLMAFCFGVIPF